MLELADPVAVDVNGDVPAELDPIVMRALERDPTTRHATAKEMSDDLEEVLRKRGYGAQNDRDRALHAGHVQGPHRRAQEAGAGGRSKGSASAEILDAAFSEPLIASGSAPGQADFSVRFRRNSLEMAIARPNEEPSEPNLPAMAAIRSSAQVIAEPAADEPVHAGARPLMDTLSQDPLAKPEEKSQPQPPPRAATIPPPPRTTTRPRIGNDPSSPSLITTPKLEVIKKRTSEPVLEGVALAPTKSRLPIVLVVLVLAAAVGSAVWWYAFREPATQLAPRSRL